MPVHRTQIDRATQHVPRWWIGVPSRWLSGCWYGTWPWTILCNIFWEYHAPCILKTSFVGFEKERCIVAVTKDCIFRPYSTLHIFRWQSKVVDLIYHTSLISIIAGLFNIFQFYQYFTIYRCYFLFKIWTIFMNILYNTL